jgi:hypothetical protein
MPLVSDGARGDRRRYIVLGDDDQNAHKIPRAKVGDAARAEMLDLGPSLVM